jgi:hypothetical protein
MLIALLGLSGFTGLALGWLYLVGDARSDASDRVAVSAGANEAAAARPAIPAADGFHDGTVAMVARAGVIEAATSTALPGLPPHGLADGSMPSGGSESAVTDKSPASDDAAAAYDAGTGADAAASAAEERPQASERVLHITNVGDRIVITDSISGARMIPVSDAATEVTGEAYTATAPVMEPVTAPAELVMATVEPVVATAPVTNVPMSGGVNRPQPPADVEEDAGSLPPRADYEDVYPGCPRVLPQGAGEEMAKERLALYGCLYYAECAMPTDTDPAICIWYLNQKI